MKVVITGFRGLLGWHLRCRLASVPGLSVGLADRGSFADVKSLAELMADADVVVHLAGVNRGSDDEIETGNLSAAGVLVDALDLAGTRPTVVYSSSIHVDGQSVYGGAKRRAGEVLGDWAGRAGARFVNLVLPHVFGEHARPFYNSVVATFAHQLAGGDSPEVISDSELHLLHAQDVADLVLRLIESETAGDVRPEGFSMTVTQLLGTLSEMDRLYRSGGMIPDLRRPIDVGLFNTYRSYLYPQHYPVGLELRSDDRGRLFEAVRSLTTGQAFISTTHAGIVRGNHYHRRKVERFLVLEGEAEIRIRRLMDDEVRCYSVSGSNPQFVDIPTLHTHNIVNSGTRDLLTMFWANEIFDPTNPDTEAEQV